MGKFKLYRNFNGSFRGETITVPDDMDLMVLRSGAGERVKEFTKDKNKMILFNQNVEQFVDMTGNLVGPFVSGELANLDSQVSEILVQGGKARFMDENN